jgi:O-antigen biosynthesis protein
MKPFDSILNIVRVLSRRMMWVFQIVRTEGLDSLIRRVHERWMAKPGYETWLKKRAIHRVSSSGLNPSEAPVEFLILMPAKGSAEAGLRTLASLQRQNYPRMHVYLVSNSIDLPLDWQDPGKNWPVLHTDSDMVPLADCYHVIFPGDELNPYALVLIARAATSVQLDTAFIYSDDDRINLEGHRHSPRFKPDWSPDFYISSNYIGKAVFFCRSAIEKIGGFDISQLEPSNIFELGLRSVEINPAPVHISDVLYSVSDQSIALDDPVRYQGIIQNGLERRGESAQVDLLDRSELFFEIQTILLEKPLVSILICTRDKPDYLNRCLDSIFTTSTYPNFEIILVDNNSQLKETLELIAQWLEREPARFSCIRFHGDFNFSLLNNLAARQAKGELLLLLNNDTQVITPSWIEQMAAEAQRPNVGCVGAVLLYPNGRIQHGGIILGCRDFAVHAFKDEKSDSPGYLGQLFVKHNLMAVTAACLMVGKDLYQHLGGFDEAFAVAGGDIDFCLRAHQIGKNNLILPRVRLYHHESATRGFEDRPEKIARLHREFTLLRERWAEFVHDDPFYNPNLDRAGRNQISDEFLSL